MQPPRLPGPGCTDRARVDRRRNIGLRSAKFPPGYPQVTRSLRRTRRCPWRSSAPFGVLGTGRRSDQHGQRGRDSRTLWLTTGYPDDRCGCAVDPVCRAFPTLRIFFAARVWYARAQRDATTWSLLDPAAAIGPSRARSTARSDPAARKLCLACTAPCSCVRGPHSPVRRRGRPLTALSGFAQSCRAGSRCRLLVAGGRLRPGLQGLTTAGPPPERGRADRRLLHGARDCTAGDPGFADAKSLSARPLRAPVSRETGSDTTG